MTVLMGELVGARIKNGYHRLTQWSRRRTVRRNPPTSRKPSSHSSLSAFRSARSRQAPQPPLFNAPPVFETNQETGVINNLSTYLTQWEFLLYGLLAVVTATVIAYPFAMNYAYRAASAVVKHISHEAVIAVFTGLVVVISIWEGGVLGLLITVTVGLVGGLLGRLFKIHGGVLFMGYYVALFSVPALINLF